MPEARAPCPSLLTSSSAAIHIYPYTLEFMKKQGYCKRKENPAASCQGPEPFPQPSSGNGLVASGEEAEKMATDAGPAPSSEAFLPEVLWLFFLKN